MDTAAAPPRPSRWPVWIALAYTAFPVYGSLIPFRWSPMAPAVARQRFLELLDGPLALVSRADFAANVLLSLPLAILWLAALVGLFGLQRRLTIALAAAVVWLGCTGLGVALEFAQMFFGGRQSALSDVAAQSIGAALGVSAWGVVPRTFWQPSASPDAAWRRALVLYLTGLVLYALLPLDLTVSRSEIAAKWKAGQVHPLPFLPWRDQPLVGVTDFLLDAAIWALAAVLVRRSRSGPLGAAAYALVGLAAVIEAAQMLVISRVVDATDIVAAAAGVGVVALLPWKGDRGASRPYRDGQGLHTVWPVLAACAILLLHTWPFDFVVQAEALRPRLGQLTWMPFASYATNTELYLVTNVLRRVALYGAFSGLCAWALQPLSLSLGVRIVFVAALAAGLAALIEALQVMLPGRVVDTGDVLIASCAGALAVALWPRAARLAEGVSARPRTRDDRWSASRIAAAPVALARARRLAISAVGGAFLVALLLAYAPSVPYNLRELLAPDGLPWPAAAVTAGALAMFCAAAWVARSAAPTLQLPVLPTLAGLLGLPVLMAALLLAGAPRESVHDLVGSPVLGTAGWVETAGRLAILLLGAIWTLALGHALHGGAVRPGYRAGGVAHLLLHGLWLVPLWHLVVVVWAGTDNLTELMSGGGGLVSTACLLGYGVLVGMTGSAMAGALWQLGSKRLLGAGMSLLASLALGWLLLTAGTEPMVFKYGRTFSALQFLLSPDRNNYVEGVELMLRYAVAHLSVSTLAGVGQWVTLAWPGSAGGAPRGLARAQPDASG